MPRYRLALFDFDGTLADSFPFFVEVLGELARRHGFTPVRPEQIPLMRRQDVRQSKVLARSGIPAAQALCIGDQLSGLRAARAAGADEVFLDVAQMRRVARPA